ncbi:Panacea domain-containing protein [Plantactinospora sp. WMMC1484]|uniref:Panacea domain-containing protein n=1 Tax=Plantactinospora sp. WMMC1484 TaxID=3404122 RepID=UPI003BF49268
MASVYDVAAYILAQQGEMSSMKLQKLVYYSQAWHLVWDDEPLFPERIQAWANGPVVYDLYALHRGRFSVSELPLGNPDNLTRSERETIDAVLRTYGHLDGRKLSHLTHGEDPWAHARRGLPATARSSAEITPEAMQMYYSTIDTAEEAIPVDEISWDEWAGDGSAER